MATRLVLSGMKDIASLYRRKALNELEKLKERMTFQSLQQAEHFIHLPEGGIIALQVRFSQDTILIDVPYVDAITSLSDKEDEKGKNLLLAFVVTQIGSEDENIGNVFNLSGRESERKLTYTEYRMYIAYNVEVKKWKYISLSLLLMYFVVDDIWNSLYRDIDYSNEQRYCNNSTVLSNYIYDITGSFLVCLPGNEQISISFTPYEGVIVSKINKLCVTKVNSCSVISTGGYETITTGYTETFTGLSQFVWTVQYQRHYPSTGVVTSWLEGTERTYNSTVGQYPNHYVSCPIDAAGSVVLPDYLKGTFCDFANPPVLSQRIEYNYKYYTVIYIDSLQYTVHNVGGLRPITGYGCVGFGCTCSISLSTHLSNNTSFVRYVLRYNTSSKLNWQKEYDRVCGISYPGGENSYTRTERIYTTPVIEEDFATIEKYLPVNNIPLSYDFSSYSAARLSGANEGDDENRNFSVMLCYMAYIYINSDSSYSIYLYSKMYSASNLELHIVYSKTGIGKCTFTVRDISYVPVNTGTLLYSKMLSREASTDYSSSIHNLRSLAFTVPQNNCAIYTTFGVGVPEADNLIKLTNRGNKKPIDFRYACFLVRK